MGIISEFWEDENYKLEQKIKRLQRKAKKPIKAIEFRIEQIEKALAVKNLPQSVIDDYSGRLDELKSLLKYIKK